MTAVLIFFQLLQPHTPSTRRLVRRWKPIADRLRPEDLMVAHTGFLIFARHQERSALWDEYRTASLGTRERKQEAARRERLGMDDVEAPCGEADD